MRWDSAHHQGAAYPAHILRPVGVYSILTSLCRDMHLRPRDLANRLEEANIADAPLVGLRDLSKGISDVLKNLREQGLIVRCAYNGPGSHTRYDITKLGAGLVGALGPVTAWAMSDFDFVVAAARVRVGLPPLDGPVPDGLRQEHRATGMAIGLLSGTTWSNPVLVYVDSAGADGVGPQDIEDRLNADLRATTGRLRVEWTLQRPTLYATLRRLMAMGLVERLEDSPHVRYRLSSHGQGLMGAWWQVAEDWGIEHIDDLFPIMVATSVWFTQESES